MDGVCSRQSGDNYLSADYSGDCSTDGVWQREDTDAIRSNPYYQDDVTFPIPDGLDVDATVEPQQVAARAYDTVLIPMDDGNWHVTVYCPASLDVDAVDEDGHEIDTDTLDGGDNALVWELPTGLGTAERPCVTVEVTVGGQRPFWSGDVSWTGGRLRRVLATVAVSCVTLTVCACSPLDVLAFLSGCTSPDSSGTTTSVSTATGEWTRLVGRTMSQLEAEYPSEASACSSYDHGFQCTWWACVCQRMLGHEVGRYWGNGQDWGASAQAAGWRVRRSAGLPCSPPAPRDPARFTAMWP